MTAKKFCEGMGCLRSEPNEENMKSYPKEYLDEVVETQGKLFLYAAENFSEYGTVDFITRYMKSKTRASIDEGQVYVCTMDCTIWI